MTQTTNYQLPQWGATDRVRRGDFNSAMSKIDTQMKANANNINTKAASSTVTSLQTTVNNKADSSAVQTALAGKADASDLTALQTTVSAKADASDLVALQTTVNGKADASALAAIAAGLGTHGKNARIAWGSYVGTGEVGEAHPNSLTFDFHPVVVFCTAAEYAVNTAAPTIFLRDVNMTHPDYNGEIMFVTWSSNGLSWYHKSFVTYQDNDQGLTYYYIAIGYDD